MTIGERIKEVRMSQSEKLTQTEFGQRLGVSKDVIANLEYDRVKDNDTLIRLICNVFSVSYGWIKFGEGPMLTPDESQILHSISGIMNGDNEFAKRVFKEFASMPVEAWEQLEAFVDRLSAKK